MPVDGVLFDCDGVLVDSLEAAAVAWDAWAERYAPGFDFRTQIVHGVRATEMVATLVEPDLVIEAVTNLDDAELASAVATAAIPGAVALTDSIPVERWAVVTSAIGELARRRLAAAGHRAPRVIVAAEDVARGKPDPEPYLAGARLLGLDPSRCAVIEDAPAGVRAARAAGARFVVGVGDHLEGTQVDAHVPDLRSLFYRDGVLVADCAGSSGWPNPTSRGHSYSADLPRDGAAALSRLQAIFQA